MSKTLSTILIVLGVVVVAGGLFFFGTMYGRMFAFGPDWNNGAVYGPNQMMRGFGPGMMGRNDWNDGNGFGPGMMGRNGWNGNGGYGPGMMGGNGYGPGMMGRGYSSANAAPLTVDQARAAAEKYMAGLNNSDLAIADIMIFSNHAYVAVKETSTGRGAFELLVDPVSQVAYPEHGPNMMWNTKYGAINHQHMMGGYGGGMMGNYGWSGAAPSVSAADMSVTSEQAVQAAQQYLDASNSGATAAKDPMQFYGYYTIDFSKDGKIAGMLSVNGYTGQVFLHTWHGAFLQEAE